MIIRDVNKEKIKEVFSNLDGYINKKYEQKFIRFVDIGSSVIKIVSYCEEYLPLIEKQLMYVSKTADKFDATLIVWKEDDIKNVHKHLHNDCNPAVNLKLRINMLTSKRKPRFFKLFSDDYSKMQPQIESNFEKETFCAHNIEKNTYYYAVKNLEPEEFIKEGHIFVQAINRLSKTDKTNIAHGAVVGVDGNGVLFCARGQRGKSTLTVLSMLKGFEYVSDDYLILDKEGENLYTHPIYSIITLSPRMYNELYDELKECRFVSNNARKDKYVFNIANFESRFKKKYPIKICMFPEIVSDKDPSIHPCEKGRAIVQLIQSTVSQMRDMNNKKTIKKMLDMISGFDFYKINLCSDINRNTEFLREFLKNIDKRERKSFVEDEIYQDITFDIANFLDTKNAVLYQMNHFATNIYENLLAGVDKTLLLEEIKKINGINNDIEKLFNIFVVELNKLNLLKNVAANGSKPALKMDLIEKNDFKLSFRKFGEEKNIELIEIGE